MARDSISDETHAVMVQAIRTLYGLVRARGRGWAESDKVQMKAFQKETLPDFEVCMADPKLYSEILERTATEIHYKAGEAARIAVNTARSGVEKILASKREKIASAVAFWDSKDDDERTLLGLGERPRGLPVKVSALLPCFPKGTNAEQATMALKSMGYSLVKGPQSADGPRVWVAAAPAKPLASPTGHGAALNAEVDAEIAARNAAGESDDTPDSDETPDSNAA